MSADEYIFDKAERVLRSGGLVIVPTETFYCIGADPFQELALQRIFAIKARSEAKPLPLIAADRLMVEQFIQPPGVSTLRLMDRFWPGSLTILLNPAQPVSPLLTGPEGKIGVRVPPWCAARILAARLGGWLTATSANIAGETEADDVSKIGSEVIHAVDMVMNLGATPGGKPSTVVEAMNHEYRIVRHGAIDESVIREVVTGTGSHKSA